MVHVATANDASILSHLLKHSDLEKIALKGEFSDDDDVNDFGNIETDNLSKNNSKENFEDSKAVEVTLILLAK
jgi:hypothetical protein